MKTILTLVLTLFCTLAFCQKKGKEIIFPPPVLDMHYPNFMSACELPAHKKELVYTRFIYRGTDEYWSLVPDKKCNAVKAELEIPDSVEMRQEFKSQFKNVHDNYWNTYLLLDVIGVYEDGDARGYGHLGSNKSKFTLKYFIDVQTVKKKNQEGRIKN
jgi:hypothetical protein